MSRFLELLLLATHVSGGQPARGTEIGSIKFRNSRSTARNLFVHGGDLFYVTEYHKTRASTNLSHIVARFPSEEVSELILIFVAYIRPFANMIYNQVSAVPNNTNGNYLFSDEADPDQCWSGRHLSRIMQQASSGYLGTPGLSVWSYRHLASNVTKRYIKKIAGFFQVGEGDDTEWAREYTKERSQDVYAWQMGHTRKTNATIYGLDMAYPSQIQPELLDEYRCISVQWHDWLQFKQRNKRISIEGGSKEPMTPKKRKQTEDSEDGVDLNVSPESQRLKKMSKDLERLLELRREEKKLRERYNM